MHHAAAIPAYQAENILFGTLLQLAVIILAARGVGVLFRRFGQPTVVGEIVAGLALGPSFFGYLAPGAAKALFDPADSLPIMVISQIGLIFLMFQIGNDFDLDHFGRSRNRTAVVAISAASVIVPLGLGILIGIVSAPFLAPSADVFTYSLFVGVALAITAVPVLGRIMNEFNLTRTEVGTVAISAAAVNDVVGWTLLAGISAYAIAAFSPLQSLLRVGGIVAFAVIAWTVGRPAISLLLRRLPVTGDEISPSLMAVVIVLLFGLGICTYSLGIFAIFGGFAGGLLFQPHRDFVKAWNRQVGRFVLVFFLPVFFAFTGLRTNILGLATGSDLMWCLVILAAAIAGKIFPVYLAARYAGFGSDESVVLGTLMNTRGLMELIVLNIGFQLGVIPQTVFSMLVVMAVVTTILTAPLLRVVLPRIGHRIPVHVEA